MLALGKVVDDAVSEDVRLVRIQVMGRSRKSVNSQGGNPPWRRAAQAMLTRFPDRELVILEGRALSTDKPRPTLQELGDRFEISRERVRQIEERLLESVYSFLEEDDYSTLRDEALRFRAAFGRCLPIDAFERNYSVSAAKHVIPLEEQLLLFLAGPYRLDEGWLIEGSLDEEVADLITASVEGSALPIDEVTHLLEEIDVSPHFASEVLARCPGVRRLGGVVVRWDGTLADKAAIVLALEGRPMSSDEIHSTIGSGHLNTLKNYLGSDSRFVRRGLRNWGLTTWGGTEYKGVADAMERELKKHGDSCPVGRLKRVLHDRFEISPASVELMSVTHPRFVREGAWVCLRGADEPYIPDSSLEECRGCYQIRDMWALRIPVDHDVLRGSGRQIPEPFAVHLGVFYGSQESFTSEFQTVNVGWPAQHPGVGSIRVAAEALDAKEGDHLFVIAESAGEVGFLVLGREELEAASPTQRLLMLVGADTASLHEWRAALASALGLPTHATLQEIEHLLEARREHELLRLFRIARSRARSTPGRVEKTGEGDV